MDPQTVFCPNLACPARGRIGKGNIHIHSHKERRYKCDVCDTTFAENKGTVLYRLRTARNIVFVVLTLLAYGCPIQAIVVAFDLDERTVRDWQSRAGQHCANVHEHLVQQPRDLGQVQCDEIRVKKQGGIVWMANALQVSTRLWLGGIVHARRDLALITALIGRVRASALCRPLLFCTDGLKTYVQAVRNVFREPLPRYQAGRPHLRPWDNICIAQVIKQYAQGHVVGVVRRVVQGSMALIETLIVQTQGEGVINVAYIERLNATFRSRLNALVRRGRALVRQTTSLEYGLYLIGTVYNFCTYHESLRLPGIIGGHKWIPMTPAMAARITDHCWTIMELLTYRVPPTPWRPPKRRGRVSYATKQLVTQWCT